MLLKIPSNEKEIEDYKNLQRKLYIKRQKEDTIRKINMSKEEIAEEREELKEKQEWKEWKSMLLNDSTYFLWKLFRGDYGSDMDFIRYQLGVPEKFLGDTRVYYYIKKWKEKDSKYIEVKTYQYPIKKLLSKVFGL